jgi:large repetitive protein
MNRRLGLLAGLVVAFGLLPAIAQADSTWYVGSASDGCPNAQFSDLTTAVTYAQSHDIIRICPGTYTVGPAAGATPTATTQGLVIDKALTIIGAGAAKVTIEPATNLVSASSTTDNVRDQEGNVVTVEPPPLGPDDTSDSDINVAISGVTISNGGFLVDSGLSYYDSAGTVTSSIITPYVGTPVGPTGDPNVGWGVVASDEYAVTPQGAFERDVTVSGDSISSYGGGGVLIDGSEATKPIYFRSGVSTTGAITNNVITGANDATRAQQYGIQVNAGARAAISGNNITNNLSATPGTATNPGTGVGILLTDADLTSTPAGSTSTYMSVSGNDLLGNGYGLFNGTADFPGAAYPTGDANAAFPIDVNGTGTTPANLPTTLTNSAQSTATVPVTVTYGVPGVALAQPSKVNWFGPDKGVIGGPSTGTDDGYSESTQTAGSADSVKTGTLSATRIATPAAPTAITDAAPSAAWGTPDGTYDTTVTAGLANELLVLASDDFGVASVDITANGTDLGSSTLPPYEATWTPSTSLIGQTVPLVATVTDSDGQTTVATLNVQVVSAVAPSNAGSASSGTGGGVGSGAVVASVAPKVELPSAFGTASSPVKSVLTIKPALTGDVSTVVYMLGGKVICTATVEPFTCSAKLTGADVGADKLVIVATGKDGLSTTVTKTIHVAKFDPKGIAAKAKPADGKVSITGSLKLPAAVTAKLGYTGKVTLAYGKHKATTKLGKKGTFGTTLEGLKKGAKVKVTFTGNGVLTTFTETIKVA